jgi:hypothetical protein
MQLTHDRIVNEYTLRFDTPLRIILSDLSNQHQNQYLLPLHKRWIGDTEEWYHRSRFRGQTTLALSKEYEHGHPFNGPEFKREYQITVLYTVEGPKAAWVEPGASNLVGASLYPRCSLDEALCVPSSTEELFWNKTAIKSRWTHKPISSFANTMPKLPGNLYYTSGPQVDPVHHIEYDITIGIAWDCDPRVGDNSDVWGSQPWLKDYEGKTIPMNEWTVGG